MLRVQSGSCSQDLALFGLSGLAEPVRHLRPGLPHAAHRSKRCASPGRCLQSAEAASYHDAVHPAAPTPLQILLSPGQAQRLNLLGRRLQQVTILPQTSPAQQLVQNGTWLRSAFVPRQLSALQMHRLACREWVTP